MLVRDIVVVSALTHGIGVKFNLLWDNLGSYVCARVCLRSMSLCFVSDYIVQFERATKKHFAYIICFLCPRAVGPPFTGIATEPLIAREALATAHILPLTKTCGPFAVLAVTDVVCAIVEPVSFAVGLCCGCVRACDCNLFAAERA